MKPKSTLILDNEFIQYCELNKIKDIEKLSKETFNRGFSLLKYGETPTGNHTKEIVEVPKEIIKEVIVEKIVERIVEVPVEVIKEVPVYHSESVGDKEYKFEDYFKVNENTGEIDLSQDKLPISNEIFFPSPEEPNSISPGMDTHEPPRPNRLSYVKP